MDDLMHAILIEGGSPDMRAAKAKELLKGFFEDDPYAAEKLDKGVFEDLLEIGAEEGKEITVGMIAGLTGLFKQKPFASTGRACVIEYGERMNAGAQNKLLKLLEEPAGREVIMILTANAQRLLPTVRSRCMRIWLGYGGQAPVRLTDDLRTLTAALIYGKGSLAEANAVFSRYEGSREEAADFLSAFQVFLRGLVTGRLVAELADDGSEDGKWLSGSAAKVGEKHAGRMREGVRLAEKALWEIERGYRIRYALRGMALAMRSR
ncbi:MAG: hypothetical protein FWG03_02440 [Clostridiales bacterium]|nr:hypothetical protein [Clostridiales bacterium]